MELDELLNALDRTEANLTKLDQVRARAARFMPAGPARGSDPEYDDLRRTWSDLLAGLPPIDGWTITCELPDINALGQAYIDCWEIGMDTFAVSQTGEQPGRDLAEYHFRLNRARRRAAGERLQQLALVVDTTLPRLLDGVPRDSEHQLTGADIDQIRTAIGEIERLLGDTAQRRGRWGDLHRHFYFGQGRDWHDIKEFDWPSVRTHIEAAALSDPDPLPVPNIDLGMAAAGHLTGKVVAIDEDTGQVLWQSPTGDYPDGLAYDPVLRQVWTTNESGGSETVVDAATGTQRGTVVLGGEAGNVAYDTTTGSMLADVQTRNQLAVLDPAGLTVTRRVELPGCDHDHGLTMDVADRLAFVACDGNAALLTVDLTSWQVTGSSTVGRDPDVLVYDAGAGRLYVAAESGWVTILDRHSRQLGVVGRSHLADGAHVGAVDPTTHHSYYPIPHGPGDGPVLLDAQPT